jgi:hypothetical protein
MGLFYRIRLSKASGDEKLFFETSGMPHFISIFCIAIGTFRGIMANTKIRSRKDSDFFDGDKYYA